MTQEQIIQQWKSPYRESTPTIDSSRLPNPAGELVAGDEELRMIHGGAEDVPTAQCTGAMCTITVTILISCFSCDVSRCNEEGTCAALTFGCC